MSRVLPPQGPNESTIGPVVIRACEAGTAAVAEINKYETEHHTPIRLSPLLESVMEQSTMIARTGDLYLGNDADEDEHYERVRVLNVLIDSLPPGSPYTEPLNSVYFASNAARQYADGFDSDDEIAGSCALAIEGQTTLTEPTPDEAVPTGTPKGLQA